MKLPTWPQVALIALLLGTVVATHIWAPLAVSTVTSIVSTLVGAFFVNLGKNEATPNAAPIPTPALGVPAFGAPSFGTTPASSEGGAPNGGAS